MLEFNEEEWQINLPGNNQLQNYLIPIVLLIAGLGAYSYTGFCSVFSDFLALNIFHSTPPKPLLNGFGAQSFSLLSYGSGALVLGGFLLFSALLDIGAGSIRFDKNNQQITLAFKGYPGKNERIFFSYSFKELQCIKIMYTESPVRKQGLFLVLLLSTQPQVPSEEWAERAKVLQKLRKINLISPEFCGKVSASPEKQNVRKRIIPRKMLKRRIPQIIPKHSTDNQSGRIKLKSAFL